MARRRRETTPTTVVVVAAAALSLIGGIAPLAAVQKADAATMLPLAGLCTGDAGVGVGCGFDASRMTAFGVTIAPKRSVLRVPWCPEHCYESCPPKYPIAYECDGCVYQDASGDCYRNAYNVQATASPTQGGCYETKVADNIEKWKKMTKKTSSSSSGFIFRHSQSKTTKKFYSMFFRQNYSLALSFKYVISHSVTQAPSSMYPEPSKEFRMAALMLPTKFEGNEDEYEKFIDAFGTHYMSEAFMGGSALLTNYFHSCFLNTFQSKEVSRASSSSFAGIFSDNKASGWGSSIDKSKWDSWSQIDLKLNGGDAADFADLGTGDKLSKKQVAAWQSTIRGPKMVPLTYTIRPITDVLKGGWVDAAIIENVNQALSLYDARIGVEMRQLQESMVAKNEYKKPKWCKPKKPPKETMRAERELPALDLPSCPALPPAAEKSARRLRGGEKALSVGNQNSANPALLPPIPGLLSASGDLGSLFARGFDPLQEKALAPVVSFHYNGWACNAGNRERLGLDEKRAGYEPCLNVWTDPVSKVQFSRPDEVQIFNTPAAQTESSNRLFVDLSSYKTWKWSQHSTSIGLGIFSYSHSNVESYLSEIMDTKRSVIAVKRRQVVAYQMTTWDAPVLRCEMQDTCTAGKSYSMPGALTDSGFRQQRDALPTSCAGSAEKNQYHLFREAFGTHYVESALYGGSLEFVLVINSTLYTKMSAMQVQEQTSIGFNLLSVSFAFNHGKTEETRDVTKEFRQNTKVVLFAYGGNTLYLQEGDYSKWASSVPTNPAPINSTYREIVDLFDAEKDGDRRSCMEKEVKKYLNSKPPRRYRCGDTAGTKVLNGIPHPKTGNDVKIFSLGSLPTLEEAMNKRVESSQRDELSTEATSPASDVANDQEAMSPQMAHAVARAQSSLADGSCDPDNVIQGASPSDLLGKTFDIKTGVAKLPATTFTCKQSKQWYSPYKKKVVQIPDQVDFVGISSACQEEQLSSITNETTAWRQAAESWGFSVGFGIPIGGATLQIGIGFQKQVTEMSERMNNFTKSASILSRKLSMYRLSFGNSDAGSTKIAGTMLQALESLPVISGGYAKGTKQERAKYDQFVVAFGTHYVAGADFGSYCEFNTAYDKSFASKESSRYVEQQISISIGIQMGTIGISAEIGFGSGKGGSKMDQEFKLHSQSLTSCRGGDVTLLTTNPPQYDKWVESVYGAPSWINGTAVLRPLSDLLIGSNAATKRSCLDDAVLAYLQRK